ncbi:MAG: CDF family Co(II)/Ni(II) efflux transporter DmeF [Gammaproteobacteria bacterium]|nr:CDF family Co(II)/Ni(II) efflux transporter DmeF [Gammaproteobacteria bacterium]
MDRTRTAPWQHDHVFGQDTVKSGERRTLLVVVITVVMMVVEIAAGMVFGSMALFADGLHMGSHATALGIAVVAYVYARRRATDRRFSFGTGKVSSLAAFGSAILLAAFAMVMAGESIVRLVNPVTIAFDQAIIVATVGLAVNAISAWILAGSPVGGGAHHAHGADGHDHNLRSAYLHVLADALTSLLAIIALIAGKYAGAGWMDPAMGILGALLIARWSVGLIRATAHVLLDRQADPEVVATLRNAIESSSGDRIADIHVWSIGHEMYAAALIILSPAPLTPDRYRAMIPAALNIAHTTIEVHPDPSR